VSDDSGGSPVPSDLHAFLNGIYGDESQWLPLFEKVFARWSEVTGVRYVHESADDRSPLSSAEGRLGVRADVRIGGRAIDGDNGVLAFNSFPDDGDMVIDTSDRWFRDTSLHSRRLFNVVSHEHGHGLGLDHVCPLNRTKLMEPTVSTAYLGPQHDDVLGAQQWYGDRYERNDSTATATDLGEPANEKKITVTGAGITDANDADYYAFTAEVGTNVDVTLAPVGKRYLLGPEFNGGCGPASRIDTRNRADLRLALLAPDGSLIASADATRAGGTEALVNVPLPQGAGRYFIRVRNSGESTDQLYTLTLVAGRRRETPSAVADSATTWESLPIAVDVLANDSGMGDDPIRLRIVSRPKSGRALFDGDRIVYVPARGFSGQARFIYEVRDRRAKTTKADVLVNVLASERAGNARIDSDGDGYPDEFETWLGTSPTVGSSHPGENIAAGAPSLFITSAALTIRSTTSSSDGIAVSGRFPLADGFDPDGAVVVVSVAGVVYSFHLDADGRSIETQDFSTTAPAFRLRLRRKSGQVVGGDVRFDLRLRNADYAARWADEGLTTERRVVREPRAATILVQFDGRTRIGTVPLVFSATKDVAGVARMAR